MNLDPRIGILQTVTGPVFMAFVNGYDKPETRGTLEQIEVALGLRSAPVAPARKITHAVRQEMKSYRVEYTPRRSGEWESYSEVFEAKSHRDVIQLARDVFWENNPKRIINAPKITARLIQS